MNTYTELLDLPYTKWENREVDGEGEGKLLDIVVESSHKRETFALNAVYLAVQFEMRWCASAVQKR